MNKKNIIKIGSVGVATLLAVNAVPVSAWGPERATFTNESPATYAVFNSITNNGGVGDERDFVRIAEVKADGEEKDVYSSNIKIEAGKTYEVYMYYHNNASSTFNDSAHNYAGVAREARIYAQLPQTLTAGEQGDVTGAITWKNWDLSTGNPGKVWDEAYFTADEDVTLSYVDGSAIIYNDWETSGTRLSSGLMTSEGVLLGLSELNGIILGCDEYSGHVNFRFTVTGKNEPTPTPVTPSEDNTTPTEMPTTGPAEVILASVIVLAIIAGCVYWYKTNKAVKRTTKKAMMANRRTMSRKTNSRKNTSKKRK